MFSFRVDVLLNFLLPSVENSHTLAQLLHILTSKHVAEIQGLLFEMHLWSYTGLPDLKSQNMPMEKILCHMN